VVQLTLRRLSTKFHTPTRLVRSFWKPRRILAAVAIEGSRRSAWLWRRHGNGLSVKYGRIGRGRISGVAGSSPALYEVMFSLSLSVPFGDRGYPPEMRFAFSQLLELFQGQGSKSEVLSNCFG